MQNYHSNATTNLHVRELINNNKENSSVKELAIRFGTSTNTVSKWIKRTNLNDASCCPKNIEHALSDLETSLICSIRKASWFPLDEVTDIMQKSNPSISRISVYRTFVKHQINKVPEAEKEKVSKFKEYEPGYLHVDVTYLPKLNGQKHYLFVAIDRATRLMYCYVYEKKDALSTEDFFSKCMD